MTNRRRFVALAGAGLLAAPRLSTAQGPARPYRLAFLAATPNHVLADPCSRPFANAAGSRAGTSRCGRGARLGKSRLFSEFTRSHRVDGWLIVEGTAVSYGKAAAYQPIVDLLREYFRIEPRDDARRIREKVTGKLLTLDRALEPYLPALLALLDIPVDDSWGPAAAA